VVETLNPAQSINSRTNLVTKQSIIDFKVSEFWVGCDVIFTFLEIVQYSVFGGFSFVAFSFSTLILLVGSFDL